MGVFKFEQIPFGFAQVDDLFAAAQSVQVEVHHQAADAHFQRINCFRVEASADGTQAGDQFVHLKRLGEVIIGTGIRPGHPVFHLGEAVTLGCPWG